jgi:hypothetical protein
MACHAADEKLAAWNDAVANGQAENEGFIVIVEGGMAAYRQAFTRGGWAHAFPADLLRELRTLKSDADQLQIWNVYARHPRFAFCGDVLSFLKSLVPYPVPANHVRWPGADRGQEEEASTSVNLYAHDGGGQDVWAVDLPESLRKAELNTDWSQFPEFVGHQPAVEVLRMLDQVSLGSRDPGGFVAPFASGLERMPFVEVGGLCAFFPTHIAVHIVRDWGLILRSALSHLPAEYLARMQQHWGAARVHVPRRVLQGAYERAVLAWMIQRYGKDRLA